MATNYSKILSAAIAKQLKLVNSNLPLPTHTPQHQINPADYTKYFTDPTAYANSSANSSYDSMISALQNQQNQIMPQSNQNQHDITGWFDQTANTYNQGAAASQQTAADQSKGLQDASTAMISALGGSANPGSASVASSGLQAMGGLAGVNQANSNFDASMKGIIPLEGAQAHTNEQKRASVAIADLAAQIVSAQHEKGSLFASKLSEGQQLRLSQQSDLAKLIADQDQTNWSDSLDASKLAQDAKNNKINDYTSLFNNVAAAKMSGVQLAQAKANVASTKAGTTATKASVKINQQNAATNRIKANAAVLKAKNAANTKDAAATQKALAQVGKEISGIGGKNGAFVIDPATAYNQGIESLSRNGMLNKQGIAWLGSVMRTMLGKSHSQSYWVDSHGVGMGPNYTGNQKPGQPGTKKITPWGNYVIGPDGQIHTKSSLKVKQNNKRPH